jgi:hypothetical protein
VGPWLFSTVPHGADAPDRVLPRSGRCGSVGYLFGIQWAPTCFWACRWYTNLGPEPKICASRILGGILEAPVEMLLAGMRVPVIQSVACCCSTRFLRTSKRNIGGGIWVHPLTVNPGCPFLWRGSSSVIRFPDPAIMTVRSGSGRCSPGLRRLFPGWCCESPLILPLLLMCGPASIGS